KDDIVAFNRTSGDVYVALSTGSYFSGTGWKWHDWFCTGSQVCELGDVNGDARADVVAFDRDTGAVYVALSQSTNYFYGTGWKWHYYFCSQGQVCKVADVNGDRLADLVSFERTPLAAHQSPGAGGDVYVSLSVSGANTFNGARAKWHDWFCINDEVCDV